MCALGWPVKQQFRRRFQKHHKKIGRKTHEEFHWVWGGGQNQMLWDYVYINLGAAHYVTGNKEDAVAIKSGEDEEGRARSIPSRDITVQHLTVHGGHAISVGSEMSGGVYNVMFTDITFDGRNNGFGVGSARIKTQRGRGGVVDGVTFQNIHGEGKVGGEGLLRLGIDRVKRCAVTFFFFFFFV